MPKHPSRLIDKPGLTEAENNFAKLAAKLGELLNDYQNERHQYAMQLKSVLPPH